VLHPETGVPITYVAAEPEDEPDAVAAGEELDLIRWVSPAEASELIPGMYDPVRHFLATR
jgi:8-oxo-dGTP pyrophosphatase MutT (NUDIX family)